MSSLPDELMKLRRILLTMGAEVEQRVTEAMNALVNSDASLAERVKGGDDAIDALDIDVEAECVEILALHQPVARDLRYVLSALRINADLERIADLARGVAKRVLKLIRKDGLSVPPTLVHMAGEVRSMVSDAVRALADQDEHAAMLVRGRDDAVNADYKSLISWSVQEVADNGDRAKQIIDLLSVVRAMERMADLATNISESVVFSVSGQVVRHSPL